MCVQRHAPARAKRLRRCKLDSKYRLGRIRRLRVRGRRPKEYDQDQRSAGNQGDPH
jgi:hypothetical protein